MMWGPWGVGMGLGSLVFVALIVIGIVLVVRSPSGRPGPGPERPSARQILDERYARGEIDGEEYASRKRALEESRGS